MDEYLGYNQGKRAHIFFVLLFLFVQTDFLIAQDEQKTKELPKWVAEAIERDFSCEGDLKWFAYDESTKMDYYVVRSSGPDVTCEAVYDKNGKLIRSKTIRTNVTLPYAVQDVFTAMKYRDWTIAGTQAVTENFSDKPKYYRVSLKKGEEWKNLYFDEKGKKITPSGIADARTVEVSKEKVPETVVNSIESDFLSCKEKISWRLNDEETTPDLYVVSAEGDNVKCKAEYDDSGKLIRSKTIIDDARIPTPILKALATEYPGWKVTGDRAVITNFDSSKGYYQIYLEKDEDSKIVHYHANGKRAEPQQILND